MNLDFCFFNIMDIFKAVKINQIILPDDEIKFMNQ